MEQETAQSEKLSAEHEPQKMEERSDQIATKDAVADDQPFLLSGWKLQVLMAGLSLSMLLVGLVSGQQPFPKPTPTSE
jgi:hypothetical protein